MPQTRWQEADKDEEEIRAESANCFIYTTSLSLERRTVTYPAVLWGRFVARHASKMGRGNTAYRKPMHLDNSLVFSHPKQKQLSRHTCRLLTNSPQLLSMASLPKTDNFSEACVCACVWPPASIRVQWNEGKWERMKCLPLRGNTRGSF